MKRIFLILGIMAALLLIAFFTLRNVTKSKSPEAIAEFNQNGLAVTINYCQPAKKGRPIFGGLVPYGQVWRTGANEATLFTINRDVTVAGQSLKAGDYTLWTIPSQQGWIAIFNGETGQWGTNYDPKQDVLRVPIVARRHGPPAERFTISLMPQTNGADVLLVWDDTEALIPLRR